MVRDESRDEDEDEESQGGNDNEFDSDNDPDDDDDDDFDEDGDNQVVPWSSTTPPPPSPSSSSSEEAASALNNGDTEGPKTATTVSLKRIRETASDLSSQVRFALFSLFSFKTVFDSRFTTVKIRACFYHRTISTVHLLDGGTAQLRQLKRVGPNPTAEPLRLTPRDHEKTGESI